MKLSLQTRVVVIATVAMLVAVSSILVASGYVFVREHTVALTSRSVAIATSLRVQMERLLQYGIPIENLIGFDAQCQEAVEAYPGIDFAMVVDNNGTVLFHNEARNRGHRLAAPALLELVESGEQGVALYTRNGIENYAAVVPVAGPEGLLKAAIIVGFPSSLVASKARGMLGIGVGIGIIFMALGAMALVVALSALVTRPLTRLITSLDEIRHSATDLTRRVSVTTNGEIQRLARTFNGLMEDLQSTTVSKAELENALHALQETEERYRRVVETSPSAILVDCDNHLVFVNPAGHRLLGAELTGQLLGKPLIEFVHPDSRQKIQQHIESLYQGAQTFQATDIQLIRLDGTVLDVEITGIAFVYDDKPAAQVVVHDVTVARQKTEALEHIASHDILTGLPNRSLMLDRLNSALAFAQRYSRCTTVVFLDLDNFKFINDSLGHAHGDMLLKAVAGRLAECVREVDTVARLGGDEFVVILFDQPELNTDVIPVLERIRGSIRQPLALGGREYSVTSSIGFAVYPEDGTDAETLLRNADEAMYKAKELGRDNYQPYSKDLHKRITQRLSLHNALRQAVDRQEFVIHYLPQVELLSGRFVAMEALVRWNHPEQGLITPEQFIPLAEETGLILPLGEYVLHAACAQAREWADQGLPHLRVAVNLSPRQFRQAGLPGTIETILHGSGLDPGLLELELTEGLFMRNLDESIHTMTAIRELGVGLSIDDFGTGYSSLAALKQFPLNRLKIAQAFMHDIPDDADSIAIAKSIIALGHSMKIRVSAEGVETLRQLHFLQASGCDEIQGYLVSRPIPPERIPDLVTRNRDFMWVPREL